MHLGVKLKGVEVKGIKVREEVGEGKGRDRGKTNQIKLVRVRFVNFFATKHHYPVVTHHRAQSVNSCSVLVRGDLSSTSNNLINKMHIIVFLPASYSYRV